jgi:hypothetical protein
MRALVRVAAPREIGHHACVRGSTKSQRRRSVSAWLSVAAAGITALILVWAILRNPDHSTSWLRWVVMIGVPPIVLSVIAAVQYRRGHSTGAGAAAAAVYCVLLLIYNVRAADLYIIGALLQTGAWFVSRPRRSGHGADEPATVSRRG